MSTHPEAAPAVAVVPARPWSGRDDGPGAEHLRWHHAVELDIELTEPGDLAFVGFASDEGVRRNKGRQGAAQGPAALRRALASMALPRPLRALETGQQRLGAAVAHLVDRGHQVVVLGGGHEVAFGTYSGLEQTRAVRAGGRLGVLNLDAHFDLRDDVRPGSGTPFLQMAQSEARHGRDLDYWVLGISQAANTQALFRTAQSLGVRYLPDTECGVLDASRVDAFVDAFLESCDLVHLTIDLDVLPAAVAPGVSAPAAYGVPMEVVERVCTRVARSGKLVVVDVAELNPEFDVDGRTARAAARLVHRTATTWA
ncbi:formimidoylglutamase [Streptomyces sp. NPDC050145]|uniref:formimidoylglutamase n=1 Tax=Streptomyces sp. NPDC050145 TaxID=3365602 RepID=UPI00379AFC38